MPASPKRRIRDDTPRSIALSRQRSPVRRVVEVLPEVLPEGRDGRRTRRWPRVLLTAAAVLAFLLLL